MVKKYFQTFNFPPFGVQKRKKEKIAKKYCKKNYRLKMTFQNEEAKRASLKSSDNYLPEPDAVGVL